MQGVNNKVKFKIESSPDVSGDPTCFFIGFQVVQGLLLLNCLIFYD